MGASGLIATGFIYDGPPRPEQKPYRRTKWIPGKIGDMVGREFLSVQRGDSGGNDSLEFTELIGKKWSFQHFQDCCESVWIEDICGDLQDLVGAPLLEAEESSNEDESGTYESATWTFYRFRTIKGTVTVRWCGESNGYYSESVDLVTTDGEEWVNV